MPIECVKDIYLSGNNTWWEIGWKGFMQDHTFRNKKYMDMRSQIISAVKISGT